MAVARYDRAQSGRAEPAHETLGDAVTRLLSSLHDGDTGAAALALAGPAVIPAVRAFLFKRDPSGIYQPRRWAVEVLAALHAYDVLADYFNGAHSASDPIERALK